MNNLRRRTNNINCVKFYNPSFKYEYYFEINELNRNIGNIFYPEDIMVIKQLEVIELEIKDYPVLKGYDKCSIGGIVNVNKRKLLYDKIWVSNMCKCELIGYKTLKI